MASSSSKPSTAASASTSKRSAAAASPKGTASTVPDPAECTICLDSVKIAGGLDACPHIFCFDCILQWSKVTNKCPVCNQNFKQIIEKNINPIQEEELDAKGRKKCKRKPKTVRVKNKEQRVSYEHTGTFGRMDEDSDDDSDYADMLPNAYGMNSCGHILIMIFLFCDFLLSRRPYGEFHDAKRLSRHEPL